MAKLALKPGRHWEFDVSYLRLLGAFFCVAVFALACSGDARERGRTVYTSIADGACRAPLSVIAQTYGSRDLGVEECDGASGYRVFFVSSDANSWLDLKWDEKHFSLEQAVVYLKPIGLFPNVGGSDWIEWRLDDSGHARALIFRVTAQNPEIQKPTGDSSLSRLFVVRLNPDTACLLDVVETNEEARALADGVQPCPAASAD